ncbi:hypothetical protein [Planotetraspora mira]|uniref:Lipoprotein n=1 Tax=Planotetraspora mira TaxID=58121 RepID=A0A8J3X656_9ACTN|nr:hypothetical protein [Planotetraspora mira]GII28896.1 lipoprotein [Planotetraspora mira]
MSRTRPRRHSLLAAASGVLAIGLLSGCQEADSAASATSTTPAAVSTSPATGATPAPSPSSTGLAALSAAEIFKQAREASVSADSVHLRGTFTEDGDAMELDTTMVRGKGGTGHIAFGGQSIDLTVIGKAAYVKGDKAFYTSTVGKDAAKMLGGNYLKMSAAQKGFDDLVGLVQFDKMFDAIFSDTSNTTVTVPTEINGIPAITLQGADGSKAYVATEGEPYLLRISSPTDDSQHLDFLDYDKKATLKAPPIGKVFDISKMGG